MIYQCQKCGLSKSDGAIGSVLPQCKCDWAAPQRREWVGLTDGDEAAIYRQADEENWHEQPLLEAIEAKLREKNT